MHNDEAILNLNYNKPITLIFNFCANGALKKSYVSCIEKKTFMTFLGFNYFCDFLSFPSVVKFQSYLHNDNPTQKFQSLQYQFCCYFAHL